MGEVITIGLDIAKSVFQVHGVDGAGAVVPPDPTAPACAMISLAAFQCRQWNAE